MGGDIGRRQMAAWRHGVAVLVVAGGNAIGTWRGMMLEGNAWMHFPTGGGCRKCYWNVVTGEG